MKSSTTAALFTVALLLIPAASDAFIPIDPPKEYCRCEHLQGDKSININGTRSRLDELEKKINAFAPANEKEGKEKSNTLDAVRNLKYFMEQCDRKKQCMAGIYREEDDPVVKNHPGNLMEHRCFEVMVTENEVPTDQFFTCMTEIKGSPVAARTDSVPSLKLTLEQKEANAEGIKEQNKQCNCKVELNGKQITAEEFGNAVEKEQRKIIGEMNRRPGMNQEESDTTVDDMFTKWYRQCDSNSKCDLNKVVRTKDVIYMKHEEDILKRELKDDDLVNECVIARFPNKANDDVYDIHTCSVMIRNAAWYDSETASVYSQDYPPPAPTKKDPSEVIVPTDPPKEYCRCEHIRNGVQMNSSESSSRMVELKKKISEITPGGSRMEEQKNSLKGMQKSALEVIDHLQYFMAECDRNKQCRFGIYHEQDDPAIKAHPSEKMEHRCFEVTVAEYGLQTDQFLTCMTEEWGSKRADRVDIAESFVLRKKAAKPQTIKDRPNKKCHCQVLVNGIQITEEDFVKRQEELQKIIGELKPRAAHLNPFDERNLTLADYFLRWFKQCDKDYKCELENVQRSKDLIMRTTKPSRSVK